MFATVTRPAASTDTVTGPYKAGSYLSDRIVREALGQAMWNFLAAATGVTLSVFLFDTSALAAVVWVTGWMIGGSSLWGPELAKGIRRHRRWVVKVAEMNAAHEASHNCNSTCQGW